MPFSTVTYTATPGQTVFPVTFHLLRGLDLDVYVDDVLLALTTDYTLDTPNLNVTLVAPAAGGEEVRLERTTPLDDADLPVAWSNGAAITRANLDDAVHDLNHKIQEVDDLIATSGGVPGPPGADGADVPQGPPGADGVGDEMLSFMGM